MDFSLTIEAFLAIFLLVLFSLFLSFLQIGLFSVGGGYAAIPLIHNQTVELHSSPAFAETPVVPEAVPSEMPEPELPSLAEEPAAEAAAPVIPEAPETDTAAESAFTEAGDFFSDPEAAAPAPQELPPVMPGFEEKKEEMEATIRPFPGVMPQNGFAPQNFERPQEMPAADPFAQAVPAAAAFGAAAGTGTFSQAAPAPEPRNAQPAFAPAPAPEPEAEEISVFAEGLPDWNIEPPQIVVRRKRS